MMVRLLVSPRRFKIIRQFSRILIIYYDVLIHPTDPDKAYFFEGGGSIPSDIMRTLNGFESADQPTVNYIAYGDDKGSNEKPIVFQPGDPNVAYLGYQNIYKATDWASPPPYPPDYSFDLYFNRSSIPELIQDRYVVDIAIAPTNPNVMYVAYDHAVWTPNMNESSLIKTENALDTDPIWEILDPYDGVYANDDLQELTAKFGLTHLAVAPEDPDRLWITFGKFWDLWHVNKVRIMESLDGGDNFSDISTGLPNLPVNCIKVIGDDTEGYKIFLGNDIGVYLYDTENNPNWTLFSYHLPPCIVTDIEYIPGEGESEAIRITTFGYGIWETPLNCWKINDFEVITGNLTWDTDQVKHNNVYIASGGSLTITAKISFVGGTGLIVQEGGHLVVNGGILTSACVSLWNGVTVYGDPLQPISNLSCQGYAEFHNALVENAIAGVRTLGGAPDREIGGVQQIEEVYPAGGIIEAGNSTFRNNYIGVLINPCSGQKADQFCECSFEWSSELLPPYYTPIALVKLNDVNYIRFQGCTFRTDTSFSPNQATGIGILGYNSRFFVDAHCRALGQYECTEWKFSEFSNLDYGIKALAYSPTRTFRVDQANLSGNNTGIYASGVSTAQVTRSNFTIIKVDTISREHFGGLYLDFCNGYKVEDNVFSGPGGNDNSWAIGLIVNNSNLGSYVNADNEIYNNDFNTLNIGILPQNKNRSNAIGTYGLTLKCNDFFSCRYDIAVTAYQQNDPTLGIKNPQGENSSYPEDPAGNIFTDAIIPPQSDYNYHNEGGGLTYYHHDHESAPYSYKVRPSHYSNINPQKSGYQNFYDPSQCCLSNFTPGGGGIEDQKALLGEFESNADSINNLLALLVDGGSTQQTYQDIITSTPPEALDVYNDLIGKSPYLSDTVMVSALKQESVLDATMVTDILTENPQAAKSDTVLYELENRINPLSNDQMWDVMQGLYITGAKETLESNLAGYLNDYSRTLNNIVRYYSSDTLSTSPFDSILIWLASSDYLWARYHQAFILNERGDSLETASLLGNLTNLYSYTPEMIIDHQNYQELINYFKRCRDSLWSVLQTDSTQIAALSSIAQDSSGLPSIYATNVLSALGEMVYLEPYLLPIPGLKESKVIWPKKTIRERNSLKIYPNPAVTYCVFEIELKDYQVGATLEITDNQGRKINSLVLAKNHDYLFFPLDNLPSGLYICTIRTGGKTLKSTKLIVNK